MWVLEAKTYFNMCFEIDFRADRQNKFIFLIQKYVYYKSSSSKIGTHDFFIIRKAGIFSHRPTVS